MLKPISPVQNGHCAPLDPTVEANGLMSSVKNPGFRNIPEEQLEAPAKLERQILNGEADLVELDNKSPELRRKGEEAARKTSGRDAATNLGKRKRDIEQGTDCLEGDGKNIGIRQGNLQQVPPTDIQRKDQPEDLTPYLKKIALCHKTSFQKKVLTVLCQVPRGRYTTYAAISKHLSSSPRAVGNALKNNPFAPHVPCHRVLASGGGIGGFKGSWGRNGEEGLNDHKKRKLLRDEGVMFDAKGMVVGRVWEEFR